jgi:hypothetical protein
MFSYQHPRIILTAQYFVTEGDKDGKWVDASGNALWTEAFSVFVNVRPPMTFIAPILDARFNMFFRYDWYDRDRYDKVASDATYNMYLGGGALEIFKENYILADYEYTEYGRDFGNKKSASPLSGNNPGNERRFQLIYQLKF